MRSREKRRADHRPTRERIVFITCESEDVTNEARARKHASCPTARLAP